MYPGDTHVHAGRRFLPPGHRPCVLVDSHADKAAGGDTAKAQAAWAREGDPPAAGTQGWERAATGGLGPGTGHGMHGLGPYC